MRSFFAALVFSATTAWAAEPPARVAIIGDSISTGAAAHPALTYDPLVLWDVFAGTVPLNVTPADIPEAARTPFAGSTTLAEPRRLWPADRDFGGGPDWVFKHAMQSVSRRYLDSPRLSWGYFVAGALGVSPTDVLIAAENGSRVDTLPSQIDRIMAANDGKLPEKVFVFFTGNDLCGPALSYVTEAEDFEKSLYDGLAYAQRVATPAAGGTKVYLVSYLSVLQLLHADAILQKKIMAYGKERTCAELREAGYRPADDAAANMKVPPEAWSFTMVMPPNPSAFCPTLFGGSSRDPKAQEEMIGALANRIRAYRDAAKRVTERAQTALASSAAGAAGLSFRFISGTGDLIFEPADIAADCFHLSAVGQARVASAVLAELGD